MRLRWPASAPTLDITIPNAQLGDTETLVSNAVIRENRGQEAITYKDVDWPINTINKYSIKTMTATERDALVSFLIASAGDELLLTDHNDVVWLGVITTSIPEMVTVRDVCSYDVEFEFMGDPI